MTAVTAQLDLRGKHPRWRSACLLLGVSLLCGCSLNLPGKPKPNERRVLPNQIMDFSTLYSQSCAGCHGAEGRLGPAPPLNDPIFLAIVPEEELVTVITRGRTGTPMPGFAEQRGGPLTEAQVKAVARGLKEHWGPGQAPPDVPPYAAGKDKGDASRGKMVFAQACASCHGADGKGTKDMGPIHDPAFLGLISDQALRRIIITGRPPPDLGMPSFAGTDGRGKDFKPLTSQQISDVVALLAEWRTAGPGHVE